MNKLNTQRGQALVEFALVSIILMGLALGVTEFARAWYYDNALENGVRAGVRYASELPDLMTDDSRIQAYVNDNMVASVGSPTNAVTTKLTPQSFPNGTQEVVTVTATYPFTFLTGTFLSNYFGVPTSLTLTRQGAMYYKPGTT